MLLLPYFFDQMLWLLFFAASFYVATVLCVLVIATIQGQHLVCSEFPILKCMQIGKLFGNFIQVPMYLPAVVHVRSCHSAEQLVPSIYISVH